MRGGQHWGVTYIRGVSPLTPTSTSFRDQQEKMNSNASLCQKIYMPMFIPNLSHILTTIFLPFINIIIKMSYGRLDHY